MSGLFSSGLFDPGVVGLFGLFGSWPEPPDAIPLRILGLAEKPTSQETVKSAFRARVMQAHPDLAIYTDPGLRRAAEAIVAREPDVQELVWARDVLLHKVPAVTDKKSPHGDVSIRHEPAKCKSCNGERLTSYGEPYKMVFWGGFGRKHRWLGYCLACADDAEKARLRQCRLEARANRLCRSCGQRFTPPRSDGRYCSRACRQKSYRQRTAGES